MTQIEAAAVAAAAAAAVPATTSPHLYVSVKTFNLAQESIGYRVVDMYHYGTRNWLQNHSWWAMHNGHVVEIVPSTDDEIDEYLAAAKNALAAKFNKAA